MNTTRNRKSNSAVQKFKFWVDGNVRTQKGPLVKTKTKKKGRQPIFLQVHYL